MGTMQSLNFKKTGFILLLYFAPFLAIAQSDGESLQLADSLYNQRRYTQSYEIYQSLFSKKGQASPAMLLKMAYIQEGINNYTDALYYLNIYYNLTFNKRALRKMEELADKNGLQGFKVSDLDFFRNVLYRYYGHLILGLASLTWLIFSYMVYKKNKFHRRPGFSVMLLIFILILLLAVVNFNSLVTRGLLVGENTFLMSGPSPGSRLVEVAKKGSRVRILDRKGTWVKIQWNNSIAYVRDTDLRPITF